MAEASVEISGSATPTSKAAAKFNSIQSASINACTSCGKRVYDLEKISIDQLDQQLIFHKNCFRCSQCRGILTVRNYTIDDGHLYCKQHYMRQFREVGGKYNFTGIQTTPARSAEVTSASIHSTSTRIDSEYADTPRPVRSWEPTGLNGDKGVSSPPAVERSPSVTDRNAAVVANIRNRFETPRESAGADSGRGVHGYVEGEMSVISMMRQTSSVKARMAQFSGTGGAAVDRPRDNGPPPIRPMTPPLAEPERHYHVTEDVQAARPEPKVEETRFESRYEPEQEEQEQEEEQQLVEIVQKQPEYEERRVEEEEDYGEQRYEGNDEQELEERDRYDDNVYQNNGGQPDYEEYENGVETAQQHQQQHVENSYDNGYDYDNDAEAEGQHHHHDNGGEYDGHEYEDGAVEYNDNQ